jgi:hypothetical protein
MPIFQTIVAVVCLLLGAAASADDYFQAEIAEPYIELRTGPGRGYPIYYVIDRGARVEVLKRRTDWFKVRGPGGQEGWVTREQLQRTLTLAGAPTRIHEPGIGDFSSRRWELGVLGGDFDGADVLSVYGGYALTENLSAELSFSQALGNFSDSRMVTANLLAQPFPTWRVSPFFTLGTGMIETDPRVTLVQAEDRRDQISHVGVGVRAYLTRRFVLRAEYKSYVVFTSRNENEEIEEWKAGFSVFF